MVGCPSRGGHATDPLRHFEGTAQVTAAMR
jgi:hypothetical protein